MLELKQHPLSAAFPAMSADDYQALVDSIESIGVQNPITLYEGMVIDGWHRYRAASELMMDCPSVELDDGVDPRDFVLAQNKARRHITAAQLAMAVTEVYQWMPTGNPKISKTALSAELEKPEATAKQMADAVGVSKRTVEQAKTVQSKAIEEVQTAVKDGVIGLTKATEISKLPKEEQAAAIEKPLPKKQEESVPEFVGVEDEEFNEQLADLEIYYKLIGEDDKLKALADENKQLQIVKRGLESRINGLLSENAVLKNTVKSLRRQNDKYKKEAAHV